MAVGGLTPTLTRDGAWARVAGRFWRAVPAGTGAAVRDGTMRAGRYNRAGERTLYASASPEGVTAALARYGEAERVLVALQVEADRLVDLRDAAACKALGVDPRRAGEDWIVAIGRGETPTSWLVAHAARTAGATGLIDASRTAPGLWHLVLFRWGNNVRAVGDV